MKNKACVSLFAAGGAALLLTACASLFPSDKIAVADLQPTQGNTAAGTVSFVEKGDRVLVDARIKGLTPGQHGFHVHEKGDCSAPDGMSAGGHFNPKGSSHGAPDKGNQHGGDLGNLSADGSGNATLNAAMPAGVTMKTSGADSIVGRAVVVHADPDDLTSQPAGNSGKRIACGIVRLQ